MMGAPLVIGRAFSSDIDRGATPSQVLLGYGVWQRRFGGFTDVIGRTLALNGVPLTVIGVVDRGCAGVSG